MVLFVKLNLKRHFTLKTWHKIIQGDSRQMNHLPDESVHLVVTSPPYWQLKDYGEKQQIGFYENYESYINNLSLVWQECFRVLNPGCRLCINIGDQFARAVYYGRYKVIPIRTEIIKFCETIGLDYMGAVIWRKVTTTNTTGGATIMGSYPYPRNGVLKLDYEFILLFKKQGKAPHPTEEQKELSVMTHDEWNRYFCGHWHFAGARQEDHLARYPLELPSRLIKMFSFVDEIIIDPFLGSGTTSLAARNLGRNSIGYEINRGYITRIRENLNAQQIDLEGTEYLFLEDSVKGNLSKKIAKLPYICRDMNNLNNKKYLTGNIYGSKIDTNSIEREKYYSVKEIISPEVLKLNNGTIIRLLGVKQKTDSYKQAIRFLFDKTKGQKVFIKFDQQTYDEQNNLLCYLYLKNKTFINAHLIKQKLVEVDRSRSYKYKDKFERLERENGSAPA
jgi:site-specific DNA-methyltransferase (adenine-specific)